MSNSILSINNLSFYYQNKSMSSDKWKKILSDINMEVNQGEIVGLVGISGCGKTTLGKLIVDYFGLNDIKYKMDGNINFNYNGDKINVPSKKYRSIGISPIQMVFQDPKTSLNMRMKVYDQLKESILLKYKKENLEYDDLDSEIVSLAKMLKIESQLYYIPTNMSGGQRRRFGLAKIMAMNPKLIIADEPVASLDVSIKEQIMDVIFDLNKTKDVTLVIISHDISLLMKRADKICVIHEGELVESWNPKESPKHEATKALVDDSNYVNQLTHS